MTKEAPITDAATSNLDRLRTLADAARQPSNAQAGYGRGMANGLALAVAVMTGEEPQLIERGAFSTIPDDLQKVVDLITAK